MPEVASKRASRGEIPKNKNGIAANIPANSQENVTTNRASDFFISLIDLISDAPFTTFFKVTDTKNAKAAAIKNGKILSGS